MSGNRPKGGKYPNSQLEELLLEAGIIGCILFLGLLALLVKVG